MTQTLLIGLRVIHFREIKFVISIRTRATNSSKRLEIQIVQYFQTFQRPAMQNAKVLQSLMEVVDYEKFQLYCFGRKFGLARWVVAQPGEVRL